jgi:hypothetical protein
MLLHHALETFALGTAYHIDIVTGLELRDRKIDFPFRRILPQTKLPDELLSLGVSLLKPPRAAFVRRDSFCVSKPTWTPE